MKIYQTLSISLFVLAACSGGPEASPGSAPEGARSRAVHDGGPDCGDQFFEDVRIPMRDGQTLGAWVRRPRDDRCRLPTVLLQTPYDKDGAKMLWFESDHEEPLFDSADYAFVLQDMRCFFSSMDECDSPSTRGQDGYDTVEWIAGQSWSDGTVGTWGVSALCGQQYRTAVEQPPHLGAMVAIFCSFNPTYAEYYPGGVLRREFYSFIAGYFGDHTVEQHPYYDSVWQGIDLLTALVEVPKVQAPALVVGGWYDLAPTQSFRTYDLLAALTPISVRGKHRMLIGPWIHFAVSGEIAGGRPLDDEEKRYVDNERRIQHDTLAFFDLHLRGLPSEAQSWSRVRYIRAGEETWVSDSRWPPLDTTPTVFYLRSDGALATELPDPDQIDFPYDPVDPSPTIGGAALLPVYHYGPTDQGPVLARPDTLAFVSEPLNSPLQVRGAITVNLDVQTMGNDTDFMVRLTDVDEDGNHLLIGDGARRLKLRDSFMHASPTNPGERYSLAVQLTNELAYTFAAGHRVGLIITSSNYARFDRNPNNGDDFYVEGKQAQAVTNTLFLDGSCTLTLPQG